MRVKGQETQWLTASEVQALVQGLDGRTPSRGLLQHYVERAYVQPRRVIDAGYGAQGRPSSVAYSLVDVVLLRWLLRLSNEGVSLNRFAEGITALRRLMPEAFESPDDLRFFVVRSGRRARDIAVRMRGRSIQLTGAEGQVLLTFNSFPLVRDTIKRAQEIIEARPRVAGAR